MQSSRNCQKHLWLLSGTGEGPRLVKAFLDQGWRVSVSIVTEEASFAYEDLSLEHLNIGPLKGSQAIEDFLEDEKKTHRRFDLVVDATHPFAVEISSNLYRSCKTLDQPLIRFERRLIDSKDAFLIDSPKELSSEKLHGRRFLLAIGSRELPQAVAALKNAGADVFARILPSPKSLRLALASDLNDDQLAVLRPLKGEEIGSFERALCARWSITDVLCRQSGGEVEQLWQNISHENGLNIWLISRPSVNVDVEFICSFNALLKRTYTLI